MGKTTLARALASGRGWKMCELVAARDRAAGLRTVSAALGVPPMTTLDGASQAIADVLAGRWMVLDNLEQLVPAICADVARWVDCGARLVTTSRRPLEIAGERLYRLDPLDDEPAVRLLEARVQAARDDWSPTQADTVAMQQIAGRLQGVPLALELAAARARLFDLPALAARLQSSSGVLRDQGAEARHISMRRVLLDSWSLLSRVERRALARCAAFVGPFSPDSAEAVLEPLDADALDLLERLEAHSLVLFRDGPFGHRVQLLETVLEFARERLAEDPAELADARGRHLHWLLGTAATADPRWLAHHVDDLLAAHAWALEHDPGRAARLMVAAYRAIDLRLAVEPMVAPRNPCGRHSSCETRRATAAR